MSTQETETQQQALQTRPGDSALQMGFGSGESFALLQRVAHVLSQSTLVPKEFQGNLPNCIIALNMATRLRADPLMVMQNLYIVYNRPAWSAQFLIATLNQNGAFSKLRYEWQGEKGQPNWGCRAWAIEKATNEKLYGSWITWQMANDEGWVNKNGSKWKTMPEQMFLYRAGAWFVKAYAPEISMGLPTADEIEDLQTIEVSPGVYEVAPIEPEPPKPGETNATKAESLASNLKAQRKQREKQQTKEDEAPEVEATPKPEPNAPKVAKPEPEPPAEPEAPPEDSGADDKEAEQRDELASLFHRVAERHTEKLAKERLEVLTGFRSVSRVKPEKLGGAIDGMLQLLELPPQK